MTNVHFRSITIKNGETIAYRERDGGQHVLVLVHGNMTSSKHWDLLIETLDPSFKVYAVDMRGFGGSSYIQPVQEIKDFSEDLKGFADCLDLENFTLMGWSTGGAVSMQFTVDYPSYVNNLILLASASTRGYPYFQASKSGELKRLASYLEIQQDPNRSIPMLQAYENRDKEFLRGVWNALIYKDNQPDTERYEEYLDDMLTQRNLIEIYHALNTFNISEYHNGLTQGTAAAKNIVAPVLVLWGEKDLVIAESMTREIVEDLGTEDLKYVVLKETGHSPLMDNLSQVNNEINRFLLEGKERINAS